MPASPRRGVGRPPRPGSRHQRPAPLCPKRAGGWRDPASLLPAAPKQKAEVNKTQLPAPLLGLPRGDCCSVTFSALRADLVGSASPLHGPVSRGRCGPRKESWAEARVSGPDLGFEGASTRAMSRWLQEEAIPLREGLPRRSGPRERVEGKDALGCPVVEKDGASASGEVGADTYPASSSAPLLGWG